MKFKVVEGYKSATETHIAMERGEVDGRCGISWDTLQALNADWLRDTEDAHAGADRARQACRSLPACLRCSISRNARRSGRSGRCGRRRIKMGRPFFAPPGMAAERVDSLRRAFDATHDGSRSCARKPGG